MADADASMLDALLRLLYAAVKRLIGRRGAGSVNRYIPYKMKSYVEQNASRKFTLGEVADSVGLGISRSSQLFHETFRQSVMDYALQVRLAMAKDRIAYDNATLEEIAQACGFPTYSYFSRVFRARFGLSPSEFKRSNRTPLP
jgi:AraC family transcriptional regulator of arabinose operon